MRHTLTKLTSNTSTDAINLYNHNGDRDNIYRLVAQGTFGSGTLTFETSDDGGTTWISVGVDGIFTSDGQVNIQANGDCNVPTQIRATLAGATSPSVQCYVIDNR